MPTIERDGATLYYETFGKGFPVLTFAPAGLQSVIEVWSEPSAPIDPTTELVGDYMVIAMDQRNAGGRSHGPITADDGWDTYTLDHLAVLDALDIDRCHLFGQCIGGSFILNLIRRAPARVAAAVLAQPIGRVAPELPPRTERFNQWAAALEGHHEVTEAVLDSFYRNLYAPGFAYAVDRDFVDSCKTPSLVLAGNDAAHPRPISIELAERLPNCRYIEDWKDGDALTAATAAVREFFAMHTPGTQTP